MVVCGVFVITFPALVFAATCTTAGDVPGMAKGVAALHHCRIAPVWRYEITVLNHSSSSNHAAFHCAAAAGRGHGAVL